MADKCELERVYRLLWEALDRVASLVRSCREAEGGELFLTPMVLAGEAPPSCHLEFDKAPYRVLRLRLCELPARLPMPAVAPGEPRPATARRRFWRELILHQLHMAIRDGRLEGAWPRFSVALVALGLCVAPGAIKDPDNYWVKPILDALVDLGIIEDDSRVWLLVAKKPVPPGHNCTCLAVADPTPMLQSLAEHVFGDPGFQLTALAPGQPAGGDKPVCAGAALTTMQLAPRFSPKLEGGSAHPGWGSAV